MQYKLKLTRNTAICRVLLAKRCKTISHTENPMEFPVKPLGIISTVSSTFSAI
ncbi:MAG: hypothetical protein A4E55_02417 [Pelotomaculum sp. PtaU1.Bin035]|nr:MAG: hypothetical protein A4E55_02417 [Pelotomaculum sp. PtaU1.Bin035]